ncbi:MAG: hypothetical protein MPW14_14430 [Candidatus Manganitrophus sp.]|nr:MAG: hypothetical protein MPW14_14430 [Candidatus Manganitrophus sp.]
MEVTCSEGFSNHAGSCQVRAEEKPAGGPETVPRKRRLSPPALCDRLLLPLVVFVLAVRHLGRGRRQTIAPMLPGPVDTFVTRWSICSPTLSFDTARTTQGIGWNTCSRLERVAVGFGLAAVVGIPVGFLIGAVRAAFHRTVSPLISLLKTGIAAGLAADRPAGVQGGQPGGDLDHLHLLDLADGHQHRGRRAKDPVPRTTCTSPVCSSSANGAAVHPDPAARRPSLIP